MGYGSLRNIHVDTGAFSPSEISLAFSLRFDAAQLGIYSYVSKDETPHGTLDFDGVHFRSWYREQDDMIAFSKQFRSAVITIYGEGENNGDVWVHRYCDGVFNLLND